MNPGGPSDLAPSGASDLIPPPPTRAVFPAFPDGPPTPVAPPAAHEEPQQDAAADVTATPGPGFSESAVDRGAPSLDETVRVAPPSWGAPEEAAPAEAAAPEAAAPETSPEGEPTRAPEEPALADLPTPTTPVAPDLDETVRVAPPVWGAPDAETPAPAEPVAPASEPAPSPWAAGDASSSPSPRSRPDAAEPDLDSTHDAESARAVGEAGHEAAEHDRASEAAPDMTAEPTEAAGPVAAGEPAWLDADADPGRDLEPTETLENDGENESDASSSPAEVPNVASAHVSPPAEPEAPVEEPAPAAESALPAAPAVDPAPEGAPVAPQHSLDETVRLSADERPWLRTDTPDVADEVPTDVEPPASETAAPASSAPIVPTPVHPTPVVAPPADTAGSAPAVDTTGGGTASGTSAAAPTAAAAPAPSPSADPRRAVLVDTIGQALHGVVTASGREWTSAHLEWSQAGTQHSGRTYLVTPAREVARLDLPDAAVSALVELRAHDARPGTGTWLSAYATLTPGSTVRLDVDHATRPWWNSPEVRMLPSDTTTVAASPVPTDEQWLADLAQHPRSPEHVPAWLSASTAGPGAASAALRERLAQAQYPADAVILPTDPAGTPALEGALEVRQAGGQRFTAGVRDYGVFESFHQAGSEREACDWLWNLLVTQLPAATPVTQQDLQYRSQSYQPAYAQLFAQLSAGGGALLTTLQPGVALDRIGSIDGLFLFPWATPIPNRSLPPAAASANARLYQFVTTQPLHVEAEIVPPWFGMPGGSLRFRIAADGVGVRQLVTSGALLEVRVA